MKTLRYAGDIRCGQSLSEPFVQLLQIYIGKKFPSDKSTACAIRAQIEHFRVINKECTDQVNVTLLRCIILSAEIKGRFLVIEFRDNGKREALWLEDVHLYNDTAQITGVNVCEFIFVGNTLFTRILEWK